MLSLTCEPFEVELPIYLRLDYWFASRCRERRAPRFRLVSGSPEEKVVGESRERQTPGENACNRPVGVSTLFSLWTADAVFSPSRVADASSARRRESLFCPPDLQSKTRNHSPNMACCAYVVTLVDFAHRCSSFPFICFLLCCCVERPDWGTAASRSRLIFSSILPCLVFGLP